MKLISIGNFLDDNAPVMWRGPMLHRALEQFLSDVHWGELDTLVVDMPPGTGDMAISLGQLLPRAEVLVVTTPQPLAQEVAVRAAMMAQKTGQKLLGVVENMSGEVFGTGGGGKLADDLGVAAARNGAARHGAARGRRRRRARRRGGAGVGIRPSDRRDRRDRSRVAPRHDPHAVDDSVVERRRAPAGALRRSSSLFELVALVNLRERPDAGELDAGHLDLVLRVDALDLICVLDGARLVAEPFFGLRGRARADRVHLAPDEQGTLGRVGFSPRSRCVRDAAAFARCRCRACRRSGAGLPEDPARLPNSAPPRWLAATEPAVELAIELMAVKLALVRLSVARTFSEPSKPSFFVVLYNSSRAGRPGR